MKRWYSKFPGCVVHKEETSFASEIMEEQQSDDQLAENVKVEISLPSEIMEDILSRFPVESILGFRSVSKPWLSLTSTPSFTKLQLTRATTALFIPAVDVSTRKIYFLSAPHDGGSVTHLMTFKPPHRCRIGSEAEHVNGLVSSIFTDGYFHCKEAFVLNPSTRRIFKLRDPTSGTKRVQYFFGFDESRNEHKILSIFGAVSNTTDTIHVMIFSMSDYSWRKIDATDDITHISPECWFHLNTSCVCVNSVIHLMILSTLEILAFDLRTEKFSIVKVPLDGVDRVARYSVSDENKLKFKHPYLIKVNGCVGVVCHDRVVETNQMHIWILQDYENRVWVRETITFPEDWRVLGCPFPLDSVTVDEIIFSLSKSKFSRNVISAPIYNTKSGCFRWVQFTLDHPFLCSKTVEFSQIKCYLESIMPL